MSFGCVHCASESPARDVLIDDDGLGYMIVEDAMSYEDLLEDNYGAYTVGGFLFCPYCGRKFTQISKEWNLSHDRKY